VVTEAVNTNDRPNFFLKSSSQAIEAIDRAGHPNLAIEHDLYHMHIMEGRLVERLGEIMGRIGHIQFADAPGRHEPGTGEIDFQPIFHAIDDLGYDGWVAAEYVPSKRTEETLGWLQPWR
jgi:hydroxypyruvate isomerase